jgi:hypothetical protein
MNQEAVTVAGAGARTLQITVWGFGRLAEWLQAPVWWLLRLPQVSREERTRNVVDEYLYIIKLQFGIPEVGYISFQSTVLPRQVVPEQFSVVDLR